jgi:hypothetical protein
MTDKNDDQAGQNIAGSQINAGGDVHVEHLGDDLLHTFTHEGPVWQAIWNGDESRVLTSSGDGTAKLWDAQTGAEIALFSGDGSPITFAEWCDEDQQLLLGTTNGGVFLYRYMIEAQMLVDDACRRTIRNLTAAAWSRYFPGQPYRRTCINLPMPPPTLNQTEQSIGGGG